MYSLGGQILGGMDASGSDRLSPTVGALAENLWRLPDGSVAKRPGYRLVQQENIPGKVMWSEEFAGQRFLFYIGENGRRLRRIRNGVVEDREMGSDVHPIRFGSRLLLLSPAWWIIVESNGKATQVTSSGMIEITEYWMSVIGGNWPLTQTLVHIPLIRAGTSPSGKGVGVEAPNRLTPLVKESFVYSVSDRESKRNRFCLAMSPDVLGKLPVDSSGGSGGLNEADQAVRKATLTSSARLEVRLTKTDDYGNTTSYWAHRAWSHRDNINAKDAAFWVHSIHEASLAMDGDDNVRITYYRSASFDNIFRSNMFTLYGVGGLKDRLFAAYGNTVYYSAMDDPLYFAEPQYITVGGGGEIRLLAGEDTALTVLGDEGAWRISGKAETESGEYALDAAFGVSERLPSPVAASNRRVIAGGELLFYAKEGLCAVAPSGVLDERCIQIRSRRLEKLLSKEDPADILLHAWKDWLILAGKNGMYLLDLQRRVKIESDAYSTHGYEGYFWPEIKVDCFVKDEKLSFYRDGNLYCFLDGASDEDFHDEVLEQGVSVKRAIAARWQSGLLFGGVQRCHRFSALTLHMRGRTAVRVSFADVKNKWRVLREYDGSFSCYRYDPVYYGQWCYGCIPPFAKRFCLPFAHLRGLRLQFENDVMDQSMGLETFILEYK